MTVEEIQAWLDNPQSKEAGTGVGIESGHKIIEILKKNPSKDPELYDDVSGYLVVTYITLLRQVFRRKISSICARSLGRR